MEKEEICGKNFTNREWVGILYPIGFSGETYGIFMESPK
jgi:hypothetical protein